MSFVRKAVVAGGLCLLLLAPALAAAQPAYDVGKADKRYMKSFLAMYPKVAQPPTLDQYATVARFDDLFMGEKLDRTMKDSTNDEGTLAWWLTYYIRALDDMYRVTGDVKYLHSSLKIVRAAVNCTDDKRGIPLFNRTIVPTWGSPKYAERGRCALVVNTGLICAALFEFLLTARTASGFDASLGIERGIIADTALKAMRVHERQWRAGPEPGAGRYIGMDQENMYEGKTLPANRISAMGWAHWMAFKFNGDPALRDRALAVGWYLRHRMVPAPDGALYWPYQLSEEPVQGEQPRDKILGEDTSHAGLTMALPFALAGDGQVFTREDMARIAKMVTNGLARLGNGVFLGDITGNPYSKPERIRFISNWLPLAEYDPRIAKEVVSFFLNYRPNPDPIALSSLIVFQKRP